MSEAYKKMFWGVFIANIHLHIGAITILPSFVGFLIIFSGLSDLDMKTETSSKHFDCPQGTLLVLIILTVVHSSVTFFTGNQYESLTLMRFFPILTSILELLVFHKTLELSVYEFQACCFEYGVERYTHKDRIYICLKGISIGLMSIALIVNSDLTVVAGVFADVVAIIYLLTIFHSLKKDTEEWDRKFFRDLY